MSSKKIKFLTVLHQFYKELVKAKKNEFEIVPLLKHLPTYIRQNRLKHDRLEMGIPWIQRDAFYYLDDFIEPGFKVFEYGSGSSSHYFLKKKADLVSVEHDVYWYEKVKLFLEDKGFDQFFLKLIVPEEKNETASPPILSSRDTRFLGSDYSKYASFVKSYPDEHFDIILIDGRVRIECLKYAIGKLKKSGILIFDNSERKDYRPSLDNLPLKCISKSFGPVEYDLWFSETSIFKW